MCIVRDRWYFPFFRGGCIFFYSIEPFSNTTIVDAGDVGRIMTNGGTNCKRPSGNVWEQRARLDTRFGARSGSRPSVTVVFGVIIRPSFRNAVRSHPVQARSSNKCTLDWCSLSSFNAKYCRNCECEAWYRCDTEKERPCRTVRLTVTLRATSNRN